MAFMSLQKFHNHKLLLDEMISLYLYELKRLMEQAMVGVEKEAHD